jgi:AbrB family looped-hinge helix DNA binding protein
LGSYYSIVVYIKGIISSILEFGGLEMNLARVSSNGQITVPVDIRRALKLKEGDKMLFFLKESGEIVVNNAALLAVDNAQRDVVGCDYSEEEILADIMHLRYGEKSIS